MCFVIQKSLHLPFKFQNLFKYNSMKKHLIRIFVFLSGIALFNSCLKNDPENNSAVYYGYQQIPNINEYMPQSLLLAMGENNIHYGDEPPRIEGVYKADSIFKTKVICVPGSTWIHQTSDSMDISGYRLFDIYEQHKGMAKLVYLFDNFGTPVEKSWTDTTNAFIHNHLDQFLVDSITPVFFKTEQPFSLDIVFNTIYIMGIDPYFTMYYYDLRRPFVASIEDFECVYANIISGRIDSEIITDSAGTIVKPIIKDFTWGAEPIGYYKDLSKLEFWLNQPLAMYPRKGDIMIVINKTALYQVDHPNL